MMNSVTDASPSVSLLWLNMSFETGRWPDPPDDEASISVLLPPTEEDSEAAGFCHNDSQITRICFESALPVSADVGVAAASTFKACTMDTLQELRMLEGLSKGELQYYSY